MMVSILLLVGCSKGTFEIESYPSGAKKHEVPTVNGQKNGLMTAWYETGEKLYEVPYVDGQMHGLMIGWYESGAKQFELPYVRGSQHGTLVQYYESGAKESEAEILLTDDLGRIDISRSISDIPHIFSH
jgi:antitoxin component YwqK of YwqJK toxin-antitoxin module